MKQYLIIIILLISIQYSDAQLTVNSGAKMICSGNVTTVFNEMNLVNDGAIIGDAGSFKFTGTQNNIIGGSSIPSFYIVEIAKI